MITAADLLDGPRGRRFLLELVLVASPGSSRVADAVGRLAEGPDIDPDDLARALDDAVLRDPSAEHVVVALEATAESALWWQPPHDEDVLLAHPALRDPLDRLADRALAAAPVQALFEPMSDRWVIETEHWPRVEGERPHAAEVLADWAEGVRDEQRAGTGGPVSGSWWTSVPWPCTTTTGAPLPGLGPLALWAVEDSFGWQESAVRPVTAGRRPRVHMIDTREDWAQLCRRWPLPVGQTSRQYDWAVATDRVGDWVMPDWSGVASEYDVVHLTVAGWFRTSGIAVPVDAGRASVVAGWVPDTACWLTDPAPHEGAPERWNRSQNTGPWHRTNA